MRKLAREICFELIFEILVRDEGEMNPLSFSTLCEQENILDDQDKDYVNKIVNTFVQNKEEIKNAIFSKITTFEPDRVYKIDLALLCLGVTEIKYVGEVDFKIVINEVVELAKKFSSEKSPKFTNGVLSAIVKG